MSPSRRASPAGFSPANNNDEQQPFTALAVSRDSTASRPGRRSSIAAIFDDHRRRDETSSKLIKPNLRRLWANYDVPYIIGEDLRDTNHTLCERLLILCSWCLLVLFFPFSLFVTLKVVQEYERAVIFRLGRLSDQSARGPGMCFTLPCIDILHLVDIRTVSFDVPPQEVLTRDSVTVAVDAVVYYRVFNPTVSVANVEHAQESTRLLAQTSLRNVLGTRLLSELLADRGSVSNAMRECLDEATDNWGIKVERVEIKDVRLPKMLQRIMAAEAEAAREARAKVSVEWRLFVSYLSGSSSDHRERGRIQSITSIERGGGHSLAVALCDATALPADIERHCNGTELNDHLSTADGSDVDFPEKSNEHVRIVRQPLRISSTRQKYQRGHGRENAQNTNEYLTMGVV